MLKHQQIASCLRGSGQRVGWVRLYKTGLRPDSFMALRFCGFRKHVFLVVLVIDPGPYKFECKVQSEAL